MAKASRKKVKINAPVGEPGHERDYAEYKNDQLLQAQLAMAHGELLKQAATQRIAAATKAVAKYKPAKKEDPGLAHYHAVERMLDERAFYPAHDKRKESADYARIHQQMAVTDDLPCIVCGVKHSTLGDPAQNPFGAIQMETHHHVIEWALANAIDAAKFNARVRPGLLRAAKHRQEQPSYGAKAAVYKLFDADYAADMTIERIHEWIDHAADNLWVLCDVHHRHKYVGIHAITFPIWGPQDLVEDGLRQQILDSTKAPDKAKPKPLKSSVVAAGKAAG